MSSLLIFHVILTSMLSSNMMNFYTKHRKLLIFQRKVIQLTECCRKKRLKWVWLNLWHMVHPLTYIFFPFCIFRTKGLLNLCSNVVLVSFSRDDFMYFINVSCPVDLKCILGHLRVQHINETMLTRPFLMQDPMNLIKMRAQSIIRIQKDKQGSHSSCCFSLTVLSKLFLAERDLSCFCCSGYISGIYWRLTVMRDNIFLVHDTKMYCSAEILLFVIYYLFQASSMMLA